MSSVCPSIRSLLRTFRVVGSALNFLVECGATFGIRWNVIRNPESQTYSYSVASSRLQINFEICVEKSGRNMEYDSHS